MCIHIYIYIYVYVCIYIYMYVLFICKQLSRHLGGLALGVLLHLCAHDLHPVLDLPLLFGVHS